ncbi:3-oxoacyl-[acyl-carrier-protein] synthase II [Streptoalloteichus tenebrarius]|uniref:3-oxoacyl-[acyl-carrier-protein] synthase II n=1 Tax=Streptoalloteichus tenebrarius (strain ATCC 17920 / DSM 40477 / JCM 4838 / CBS 697.72 / NBRC 16177 / NCIMB 11028 / NRRL B-12390 / A12253. 1 / ISP 5477) TaxID=1933 RepID=A0ABT1HLZ4_STRSD|nr:beta-ketoacyl-[acyl-carrier-protein] synthase family protein [Streptoalloteichus tenebrarius]MCP2256518.1 3-oxoacyl-[acyl-carrier-protein] synthase II [Streptoalloteichus tenebrarius]BFF04869.1 beta-ketoacyl-[acyl-carrier-protein] synthase family protein [Streptoalloteichus tenebrarius]
MPPRVVVTGCGVVCPTALGVEEFARALREGREGARPISLFDTTGFAHSHGCEVTGFDPRRWLRELPSDRVGRASQFAAAAGRMAVEDAGLDLDALRALRGVVAVGTTDGGSHELDQAVEMEIARGPSGMDPALVRRIPAGALSVSVARELRLSRVDAVTLGTACAAGNYAIGAGLDALRSGEVDFALCGGADALCRRNFTGFYRLGLVAPRHCQPFDANRRGILTGEGAAVLVLETAESAARRGARVHAEVLGLGLSCDARHPIAPDEEGIARCMRLALKDAGITPGMVDAISAHGTGTRANDVTESRAIHEVFGPRPPRTIGLKAMLGHTMGAATALGAVACALAISRGFLPPTINHVETDPECALDCVPNRAVPADVRIMQNNGLAFGGNNAVVIFGRHAPDAPPAAG